MVKSLFGPRSTPGPYHYLVEEVVHSDVAALYQQLIRVIDTPTMVSQADDLAAVFLHPFDPRVQDVFAYYGEIKKLVKRVHDLNPLLPEKSRILLPDTVVRALLLRAMKSVPLYKTVLDSFIIKKPEEWATFSADDLYKHLEQINTNSRGISQKPNTKDVDGSVQANAAQVYNKQSEKKPCFSFSRTGACARPNCKFSHDAKPPAAKPDAKVEAKVDAPAAPVACQNCGEGHLTKACKFTGKCGHCGRAGHKETFCKSKKAGKPKALLLNADGSAVHANLLLCVDDGGGMPLALTTKTEDGTLCEQFWADTGANRHIHPSSKAAASFYRREFPIGTAQGERAMTSEGEGSMMLYTPGGSPMPGFGRVVFTKQAAAKLACVGDICDANMVCVFDSAGLRIYKAGEVTISGPTFTQDARDSKTGLYPLQAYQWRTRKQI
jgi:hypothetical protein